MWSGPTSATGNALYRRRSAWRHVYSALVVSPVPTDQVVPPSCGNNKLCVHPDHRVPVDARPPVHECPTCGQQTTKTFDVLGNETEPPIHRPLAWRDDRFVKYEDRSAAERPRKPKKKKTKRTKEEKARSKGIMAMIVGDPDHEPTPSWTPKPYPEGMLRLTGRAYKYPNSGDLEYELSNGGWVMERFLTSEQVDHLDVLTASDGYAMEWVKYSARFRTGE